VRNPGDREVTELKRRWANAQGDRRLEQATLTALLRRGFVSPRELEILDLIDLQGTGDEHVRQLGNLTADEGLETTARVCLPAYRWIFYEIYLPMPPRLKEVVHANVLSAPRRLFMRIDAGHIDDLEPFWNEFADAHQDLSEFVDLIGPESIALPDLQTLRLIMLASQMLVRVYHPSPSIPGPEWSRRLWTSSFFGTCFRIFVDSNKYSFEDWRSSIHSAFAGWLIGRQ
jgi:hypothetical protein